MRATCMRRFKDNMIVARDDPWPFSSPSGVFRSMPPIQLQFLTCVVPKAGPSSGRE